MLLAVAIPAGSGRVRRPRKLWNGICSWL